MGAAPWPCAIRETGKLGLVHGVEDRYGRTLDDLVLNCRYANRSLLPVPLRDVHPSHWLRTVFTASQSIRHVGEVRLQRLAVVLPRLAVNPRCSVALQAVIRRP